MRSLLFACLLLAPICSSAQKSTDATRVYRIGADGVKPPQALFTPEPDTPEKMGKVKSVKIAILSAVVGVDGHVHNLAMVRSSGDSSLDGKALEKLATWKFRPCTKDGQAVNCAMNLEVTFRLYNDHK